MLSRDLIDTAGNKSLIWIMFSWLRNFRSLISLRIRIMFPGNLNGFNILFDSNFLFSLGILSFTHNSIRAFSHNLLNVVFLWKNKHLICY
mmetsp:Transcript_20407/g.18067  ORF Transcript_20407/g.18067 Transcript_20407/m.18067 type:complete len:90 (-) Transcript_20407:276-545(-)